MKLCLLLPKKWILNELLWRLGSGSKMELCFKAYKRLAGQQQQHQKQPFKAN